MLITALMYLHQNLYHSALKTIPNLSYEALMIYNLRYANSPRFACHKTFMYLIYDVLQIRRSSVGNTLLIKRSNWRSMAHDIDTLTTTQLQDAAKRLAAGEHVNDHTIRQLLQNITTIAMQVPGSFAQKLQLRSEIRGLIVREGMAAIWLTINPSDLQNPLVLILAGVEYSSTTLPAAAAAIHQATATSNPVAVAQFFHYTCKAIFDELFATRSGGSGILGDVSNYFGVVETNGRGMLHLHALIWLRGNLNFATLRERLLNDPDFATHMIHYLETIIVQSISNVSLDDSDVNLPTMVNLPSMPNSENNADSDTEFYERLLQDGNSVACTKQMHSKHHSATCFKYRQTGSGKNACRFGMPRDLVPESKIDELGIIHLARNHAWVNPWNPAIASCIRSNHDISWIPTVSKSLALLYYITNYATKDDISPWQIVAKAALLKQSIDQAKATISPILADIRLCKRGMDKFALCCFNALAHD